MHFGRSAVEGTIDHEAGADAVTRPEGLVAPPLRIRRSADGETTTIRLAGEWDLAGEPMVREVIDTTLTQRPARLVVDLSGLSFIDASGVGAAIKLAQRSAAHNVPLTIIPGSRVVHRVFEICRLTDVLPFSTPA